MKLLALLFVMSIICLAGYFIGFGECIRRTKKPAETTQILFRSNGTESAISTCRLFGNMGDGMVCLAEWESGSPKEDLLRMGFHEVFAKDDIAILTMDAR